MTTRDQAAAGKGGQEKNRDKADLRSVASHDDCRCKEVSEMNPRELLRLMMSDLAFWKKGTKK